MAKRSIDKALREDRELKKLGLDELAQRSGIAESVIADIEAGKHDPSYDELVVLSRALQRPLPGVSGEALENGDGVRLLAESYRDTLGEVFVREVKSFTKRLDQFADTKIGRFEIGPDDQKKLKSGLQKLRKAITKVESLLDGKSQ